MGRSSYTPSTVSYLAHTAYSSGSTSASHANAHDDAHNKTSSSSNHNLSSSTSSSTTSSEPVVTHASSRPKDAPTVWALNAFDPDDEALPSIEERFLEPYEEVPHLHIRDGDMDTDTDSVSRWDDEDEEEGDIEENEEDGEHDNGLLDFQPVMTRNANNTGFSVGDARWSSASSAAAPPQSQNNAVSQTATGYAIPTAIAELASALMRQRSRYSDRVPTERNHEDQAADRLSSERADVLAGEGLSAGPLEGLDYDEPPHGNGGYYDYGYDREEDQFIEEVNDNTRAAPAAVHDFSPSAGVFHRHTLPFNLPDMGEMQMQRRASNNVTSTLATVSDAIY